MRMPDINDTESVFQAWLIGQLRAAGFRVHVTLKRLRRASIVADPDWPDIEALRVEDRRHLFIECKAHGGKVTPGQREVLAALEHIHDGTQEVYVWEPRNVSDILEIIHLRKE